jgi:tetratricopeptide (TPR) repeat protein
VADHDRAFQAVDTTLAISRASGVHVGDIAIYAQGVYTALSAGDLRHAEELLDAIRPHLDPRRPMDVCHYELLKVGLAITRGDGAQCLAAARRNLETGKALGNAMGGEVVGRMSLAVVLIDLGEHAEARRELAKVRQYAETMRSHWLAANALTEEAYSYFLTGEVAEGLARLREALLIARTQGFRNIHPWWRQRVMARLCAQALEAGIEVEYVKSLIKHRGLVSDTPDNEDWPWPIKVYTLGRFEVLLDEQPIQAIDRKQHKPLELLRVLIALRGRQVPESDVLDALWPDAEGDAAYRALITNLSRLRALLRRKGAIGLEEKCLTVNPALVWTDARTFERRLAQAAEAKRAGDDVLASALRVQALDLYRGPFLETETDVWALSYRNYLRTLYVQHLDSLGREHEAVGRVEEALAWYQRGYTIDDTAIFQQGLKRCYQCLGIEYDATTTHERKRSTLPAMRIAMKYPS